MQSTIIALVAFGMLLAFVQCTDNKNVSEYRIKQSFISAARTYDVESKTNAPIKYTVRDELLSVGKKLYLLEDGKERYSVRHDLTNIMSTWIITDSHSGKEVGTIENKLKFVGSLMQATGSFGTYKIEGDFGNYSYSIMKDGEKVASIEKKALHLHHTYDLTVYGTADRALMILFSMIVNEIREH
ncbi:unnamed protein product [Adineta ricciae]|uniref:Uncharacterized protein n=1 Tax=Adineta ricciae TaxID=249248 RepID=A0A816E9S6_ADIRI|nr:unnamed protein product [Adineta ricciae]